MKGNNKFISKILFKLLLLRGGCSDYTMMKAIQKDKIEVVKLLLQDGRVKSSICDSILYSARYNSCIDLDVIKYILSDGRVTLSAAKMNCLITIVAQSNNLNLVKVLLSDKRVELFAKDEAINCISAFSRNDDIKFLLEKCKFDN